MDQLVGKGGYAKTRKVQFAYMEKNQSAICVWLEPVKCNLCVAAWRRPKKASFSCF